MFHDLEKNLKATDAPDLVSVEISCIHPGDLSDERDALGDALGPVAIRLTLGHAICVVTPENYFQMTAAPWPDVAASLRDYAEALEKTARSDLEAAERTAASLRALARADGLGDGPSLDDLIEPMGRAAAASVKHGACIPTWIGFNHADELDDSPF